MKRKLKKSKKNKKALKVQKKFLSSKKNRKFKSKKKTLKIRKRINNKFKKKISVKKNKNKARKIKPVYSKNKKAVKKTNKKIFKKYSGRKILKKAGRRKIKRQKNINLIVGNLPSKSFFKAKIRVIGIGGGGGSIVSEIGKSLDKASFVVADTDVRAFKKKRGIKYFSFGKEMTHGLGTGLNTDLATRAAEMKKEKIAKFFEGQDIVILIACLGGGVGSGATRVFSEVNKDFKGIIFGIFTLPFKFEGKNKQKVANKALKGIRKSLNVSITIPNERIFKIIDSNTAITDAFSMVNRSLVNSLESLIDLIYSPGIINIDFADLRTVLQGKGRLAFLNTFETQGKNRAEAVAKGILNNPLYQRNNFKAEKVLFNVLGGSNLSMFEVDKISRAIAEQNPKSKIIFGISKDASYKNKIKATLLMTGKGVELEIVKLKNIKVLEKKKTIVKGKVSEKNIVKKKKKKKKILISSEYGKKEKIFPVDTLVPIFNNEPLAVSESGKLNIMESRQASKKAIRRTALEAKEAQALEENKKSEQEKEWEIPAFLRFKK